MYDAQKTDGTMACEGKSARVPKEFRVLLGVAIGVPIVLFWIGVVGTVAILIGYADDEQACTVARIPLHGVLVTTGGTMNSSFVSEGTVSADDILWQIREAETSEEIQAILLDVNSPGGTPVAADEVARALASSSLPSVALIRDMGTSAAYWAAVGTQHIIASPISDVGSIGVTMSYVELAGITEEEGGKFVEISSGTFKDAGNPDRTLTADEQQYFQGQVEKVHEYMLDRLAERRVSVARTELAVLADGKSWIGKQALGLGLVDSLGGIDEATARIAQILAIPRSEVVFCDVSGNVIDELLQ